MTLAKIVIVVVHFTYSVPSAIVWILNAQMGFILQLLCVTSSHVRNYSSCLFKKQAPKVVFYCW